jgi:hypothetical protein
MQTYSKMAADMDYGNYLGRLKALGIKASEKDARSAFENARRLARIGERLARDEADAG